MTLDKLPLGKAATIEAVGGEGALRRHFLNMGLTPGTRVTLRKTAPMGDPIELELRGYELTLRLEDAKNISIGEAGEPGEAPGWIFRTVGTLDLFEYDPLHGRAGLGILIYDRDDRCRGYAADAVARLCRYAREGLRMHQLWCNVGADNEASLGLFRKLGFREVGTKRDWLWTPDGYRDEVLLQKILK